MLLKIAIGIFLKIASKALAKFGHNVNWALVKENVDEWVRGIIPGEAIDDEASLLLVKAVGVVQSIVSSADVINQFIELGKSKDYKGAFNLLKQLVLDAYLPGRDLAMNESDSLVLAFQKAA